MTCKRHQSGGWLAAYGVVVLGMMLFACDGDVNLSGDPNRQREAGFQLVDSGTEFPDGFLGPTCANASEEATLTPLDMLLALDVSDSMNEGGRWNAVSAALHSFASRDDFAGLGVGMQLFPQREICVSSAYEDPEVPIAELPGVQPDIEEVLAKRGSYGAGLSGGTPLVPMLEGVLTVAKKRAQTNKKRKVVVVVATDGAPDKTCLARPDEGLPNNIDNVQVVAKQGLADEPSISTFVIGVGSGLEELNLLAKAGGTDQAVIVDKGSQAETEGAFLQALDDIRTKATFCELEIPRPAVNFVIKFDRVNVDFTYQGNATRFTRVSDSANCADASALAWYYDDPEAPHRIRLCDNACDYVRQHLGGKVNVVFGCAAQVF